MGWKWKTSWFKLRTVNYVPWNEAVFLKCVFKSAIEKKNSIKVIRLNFIFFNNNFTPVSNQTLQFFKIKSWT